MPPFPETITLRAADGVTLTADVARGRPGAGALVLCHPHPLYGGTRHDAVISAVWRAALDAGRSAIRFDFRRQHDGGEAERLDVAAAIAAVVPERVLLVGYSFGSFVALRVDDPAVTGWAGIAPIVADTDPTARADRGAGADRVAGADDRPTLLIAARHDQFVPIGRLRELTASWRATEIVELSGADHFLAGHHAQTAELVLAFADRVLGRQP